MSSSDEDHNKSKNNVSRDDNDDDDDDDDVGDHPAAVEIAPPDQDTLRVMISTDNHLGYCESDPVRGMDSFAAFEEVLYLAKLHKVDCVLLGGDLFHHNKPSRRTLHKTMDILKRYCLGDNPVQLQILSDQSKNFRSGQVNYEDPHVSVDLPVFSIHGNHDDPTRDPGATDMLAALDLLSVTSLVNYFGRHDQVNKVEVSPILLQKGSTRVALYGMGNMRDERLNRMWQGKKVTFLRPENTTERDDSDSEGDRDNEAEWFNIFVLHQNRDNMGRGSKNCIHESMIPNWVDLTIFGHEHASEPFPTESVVGTFRITQPGSSVATSLTAGEATRKHAVVLNVRGSQFRMDPIPLTNVRAFCLHDVRLQDHAAQLESVPEAKLDSTITKLLEEEMRLWIYNAREKSKQLLRDARKAGNFAAADSSPLQYQLQKRDQVLVRLRVEHSGYTTLNNQRFGSRFVGEVANPADILLFHRSKQSAASKRKGAGSKKSAAEMLLDEPMAPIELQQVSVEDLVKENLVEADQKLTLLTEKELGFALEEFVDKTEANAIMDVTTKLIKKQQTKMMQQKQQEEDNDSDNDNGKKTKRKKRDEDDGEDDDEESTTKKPTKKTSSSSAASTKRKRSNNDDSMELDHDEDDGDDDDDKIEDVRDKENLAGRSQKGRNSHSSSQKNPSKASASQKKQTIELSSDDDDDDDDGMMSTKKSQRSTASKSSNKSKAAAASSTTKKNGARKNSFTVSKSSLSQSTHTASSNKSRGRKTLDLDSDDFDDGSDDDDEIQVVSATKRSSPRRRTAKAPVNYSVGVASDDDEDDDFGMDSDDELPSKKKKAASKTSRRKTTTPAARGGRGGRKKTQTQGSSMDLDEDWGSASTRTHH